MRTGLLHSGAQCKKKLEQKRARELRLAQVGLRPQHLLQRTLCTHLTLATPAKVLLPGLSPSFELRCLPCIPCDTRMISALMQELL